MTEAANDAAARVAKLPEPYRTAATILGDAWRFAELAWLYENLAQHGQDDPNQAALLFPEVKQCHDNLFAAAPLPWPRRGRPRKAAWMNLPEAALNLRWLYDERHRAITAARAKMPRLRGDRSSADEALASLAKTWRVGTGRLRRLIFTKEIGRIRKEERSTHSAR